MQAVGSYVCYMLCSKSAEHSITSASYTSLASILNASRIKYIGNESNN